MTKTTGRTVVITGASAGLGRAIAHAFAREGARIGLMARNREHLEAARQEVEELGGSALVLLCDVADPEQVEQAALQVEEQWGAIDVWVNNAMTSVFSPLKQMSPEEVRRVTEVTYLGAAYGTMAALRAHHPGRLRPLGPQHPAAVRLLRRQARPARLHRFPALRADP